MHRPSSGSAAVLVGLSVLLVQGCTHPQMISLTELESLKCRWHEPKVSMWYYVGTRDGFHHFHHHDLGRDEQDFRISQAELSWQPTFPVTRDREKWRRLDWGVHELGTERGCQRVTRPVASVAK
jgi:hypothetical protein